MPTPLSPSSSQEIIPISPPPASHRKRKRFDPSPIGSGDIGGSSSTILPQPASVVFGRDLREKVAERLKEQIKKEETQSGKRNKRINKSLEKERDEMDDVSRSRITERMMSTLGNGSNPITDSDLFSRSDHFVSAAAGHQQSNRGGGSSGAATYWEVRNAKMAEQAREKKTDVLKGCTFYINGSTGPKVSNLQLQHMITSNGGRFTAMQNLSCTHIIASGGLSGSKTQKWIDGQGSRGGSKRLKIIRADWVLDCVEKGKRISDVGYGMIQDPSQTNLLTAFGVKPKPESLDKDR